MKAPRRPLRLAVALASCAAVCLPLLLVSVPPITDLSQHLYQVRLVQETLAHPDGPYLIQWLSPYGLSYLAIAFGWLAAGPELAGRIGTAILLAAWVAAVHGLAAVRGRPWSAAVLASAVALGFALYWGFLPFLGGFPLFLWWVQRTERGEREPARIVRELPVLAAIATALYLTHAQWFAAAALWLALSGLAARLELRQQILRGLALAPGGILGWLWYGVASARSFDTPPRWTTLPWERLAPNEWMSAVVGGPRGMGREVVAAAFVAWIGLGVLAWLKTRGPSPVADPAPAPAPSERALDRRLALAAAMLLTLGFLMPEYFMSLWAAKRWWGPGIVLALLAVPAPMSGHRRALVRAAPAAVAGFVFALWVGLASSTWVWFQNVELAGLGQSLAALPPNSRLLGLDYVRSSKLFDGQPFLHLPVYGPAWKGGSPAFSFARFPPSPVIDRVPLREPWTINLEWFPQNVRRSDFAHFDYVLVNGEQELLDEFPNRAPIEAVTHTTPWRLYRVAVRRR